MAEHLDPECPIARALDVIGEKWSLLILRDLFRKGPQRFLDLQKSAIGIAPNTLSARLKALEARDIIASRLYEKHPPRLEYFLTAKGKSLGPILKALYDWGKKYEAAEPPLHI
jgi:DNA-binding HxlR family transcriptional regulator